MSESTAPPKVCVSCCQPISTQVFWLNDKGPFCHDCAQEEDEMQSWTAKARKARKSREAEEPWDQLPPTPSADEHLICVPKEKLEAERAELARLRAALEFYADKFNYDNCEDYGTGAWMKIILIDYGKRAREALWKEEA